jgi:drug/metabolite transporter (DMT)-like permease
VDVIAASLLFAACNVAWRYGNGATTAIVFVRALLGAGVAWVIAHRRVSQPWRQVMRTRMGAFAVVSAAASLIAAGTMFRTIDGPLAGLAIACIPAVALLVRDRSGKLATAAALGSSVAAVVGISLAANGGSVGGVGWAALLIAMAFVATEVVAMRTAQLAVAEGADAASLVTASMVVAAVVMGPFAVAQTATSDASVLVSSLIAAVVVALFGTIGRVLRTTALPAAGVASVAASTQITALATALGGVVLLGDAFGPVAIVAALVAAGLGALAVIAATNWRQGHSTVLEPAELRVAVLEQ